MATRDSWTQEEEVFEETDPVVAVFPSRSRSVGRRDPGIIAVISGDSELVSGEHEPLIPNSVAARLRKKPFYRARPLWLVPFAMAAALIRGMTLSSRVEVYTQLACYYLSDRFNQTPTLAVDPFLYHIPPSSETEVAFFPPIHTVWNTEGDQQPSRQEPPPRCKADPAAVQASAARIQTTYSIIMGLLSALTTGWWGHFGDRLGRTKVLAISTFGWFLTDLTFILAAAPSSPLASHGDKLLLLAPVFEGILGGWSSLQSATSAYISDCTSSGSRAAVFSRFTGVTFLGFSLGPIIGGWLIRHPIAFFQTYGGRSSVTSVFCVAAIASLFNFIFILFIMPESVSKEQRERASGRSLHDIGATPITGEPAPSRKSTGFFYQFFSTFAVFLPVGVPIPGTTRRRRDWSLTLLVCALFGYLLSAGLYQIKYLYGSHTYDWGPEQLSYYISFMGGGRALFLLIVFPYVIARFKPKPTPLPQTQAPIPGVKPAKPKPTKAQLFREIKFDLRLARISLCVDIIANTAIVLAPAPSVQEHKLFAMTSASPDAQFQSSQALFVMSSWIASWGGGLVPAINSLALCISQARGLLEAEAGGDPSIESSTGKLFGALAVLQAIGQMILGPLVFGLIYSGTVATFPKAVFVAAMGILAVALLATTLVRNPVAEPKNKTPAQRRVQYRDRGEGEEEERGRSRLSKDLGYGSVSSQEAMEQDAGPSTSGSN
ncbi:MFS general substrate transporter [Favolaschia claudopus]|uniref:MFS general substrate transporter n=1 Tax=Favolaschia claudopus TaxID=2862362 RepID=A0AAW0EAE0_9AGAR